MVLFLIFASLTSWIINLYWNVELYISLWKNRKTYVQSVLNIATRDEVNKGIIIMCIVANELTEFFSGSGDMLLFILGVTLHNNISKQFENSLNMSNTKQGDGDFEMVIFKPKVFRSL